MQSLFSPSSWNSIYFLSLSGHFFRHGWTWNHPLCGLLCLACCGLLPPFGFYDNAAVHKSSCGHTLSFLLGCCSVTHLYPTLCNPMDANQASLSFIISWSLLKLMSIESVMPSNHLILCRSLLLPPSIFASIRVFPNESALHIRSPKFWSFSFSISPSREY